MDLMLGLLIAEFLVILALRDLALAVSFLPFFCAGAALILAMRIALVDGAWQYFAIALLAALISHGSEIYRRVGQNRL